MPFTSYTVGFRTLEWEDDDYYLQEFCRKYPLPQIAKITKGQHLNVGVPTLINPLLNQNVFLSHSAKSLKVAAQCVKFKDNKRVVTIGTKLSIPDSYDGWFEILSEDGRAARCIENVSELIKLFPDMCLVRENFKVFLPKTDNSEIISDKTRIINSGETLVLISEVHATPAKSKSSGYYLRCFTVKGETVYLSANQKGKFSPVAGENGIYGVHSMKNLVTKRFPIMVRLVHGSQPTGSKSNSHFVPEMRLYSLFEEESIVTLPIQNDSQIMFLPPSAHLKFQASKNIDYLRTSKYYALLTEKCKSLVQENSNKIQVFDISVSKELRKGRESPQRVTRNFFRKNFIQRSVSDPISKYNDNTCGAIANERSTIEGAESDDEIDQIYDYIRGFAPLPSKATSYTQNAINENVPFVLSYSSTPSSSAATPNSSKSSKSFESKKDRPIPPPIETIPIRRGSKEGINPLPSEQIFSLKDYSEESDMDGHIYETIENIKLKDVSEMTHAPIHASHRKNNGFNKYLKKSPAQKRIHQETKIVKYSKSSPAFRDIPIAKACERHRKLRSKSLVPTPLFNMRYKSLVNLSADIENLDSSHSGEDVSYFTGESREMLSRQYKLQRPKSLTDLFVSSNQDKQVCSPRNAENLIHGTENRKFIFHHEFENGKYSNKKQQFKRIGTLYL